MNILNFQESDITDNYLELSIIMPVYNAVKTILRSINSFQYLAERLLNNSDLSCKLYIIDDCSNDGTTQIIDDFSQSHNNIVFIKNSKNIGPGLSRNKALQLIEDGYIGFLDADDEIIVDGYIDSYIKGVNSGADWITFNGWFCSNNVKNSKYDFDRLVDDTKQLSIKCLRGELDGSVIFSIYSARLIRSNGLNFPSGYYEDIPFAYNAMLLAQNRYISNNFGYQKHNLSTSIVNTISEKHINGLIDSWLRVDNILKSYKLLDFQSDRLYGLYGYIAGLIRSIILSNFSPQYKMVLFSLLFLRINSELEIHKFSYNVETKKDKLVRYFQQNFPQKKTTFVSDINTFYNHLFNQNA